MLRTVHKHHSLRCPHEPNDSQTPAKSSSGPVSGQFLASELIERGHDGSPPHPGNRGLSSNGSENLHKEARRAVNLSAQARQQEHSKVRGVPVYTSRDGQRYVYALHGSGIKSGRSSSTVFRDPLTGSF